MEGQTFSGQGLNKKQAQAEAAEAVLRGIYFNKLIDQLAKKGKGIKLIVVLFFNQSNFHVHLCTLASIFNGIQLHNHVVNL